MSWLTSLKRKLAPELYVEGNPGVLFNGVPRPSYVLAGMIAQHLLHPDAVITQETASSYRAKYLDKLDLTWEVRADTRSDHRQRFYDYYNRKTGKSSSYWCGNDIEAFSSVGAAYRIWKLSNPMLGDVCRILSIRKPDCTFLDEDRLLIQSSLSTAVELFKRRQAEQKAHDQQQAAVKALEDWMGVAKAEEKAIDEWAESAGFKAKPAAIPHGEEKKEPYVD
jgi:hypothetical protein